MAGIITTVELDGDLCIGSLECNRIAASAFRLDEDSGVSVVLPDAATTEGEVLRLAARSCPTQAISLSDEHDGDLEDMGA